MLDLYNNKYDRSILKENIYSISLIDVLKTQILDVKFIVQYILNSKYQLCDDEKLITNKMILQYQTHITEKELKDCLPSEVSRALRICTKWNQYTLEIESISNHFFLTDI